ncbi:hypothetical protein ACNHKD_03750 [Methylocystis sp. JAN1]|uniref:hypothetical protein n=1 Tax=Methylocystis sp. JAN1 TaxID=3397211 RepID=UPI003FA2141A
MACKKIDDFRAFLQEYGFLHDVRVHEIALHIKNESIAMFTPDLSASIRYSDNEELPRESWIVFKKVSEVYLDIDIENGLRISRACLIDGKEKRIELELNEGGGEASWKAQRAAISFTFGSVEIKTVK